MTQPVTDKKFLNWRTRFLAAGGSMVMHDEAWLIRQYGTGRSAQEVALISRLIFPHEFDEFVRRLRAAWAAEAKPEVLA